MSQLIYYLANYVKYNDVWLIPDYKLVFKLSRSIHFKLMVPIVWSILSSFVILDRTNEKLYHMIKFEQVHKVSKSVKYCLLSL